MAKRVILDTDIGTDVDDCLALALILCSPDLKLEGVTCVYGDVLLRARMTLKLLELAEVADIPVTMGVRQPLLGLKPVYWAGHEGVGVLEAGDERLAPSPEHAVDFIIRSVMESPGEIHLVAIGPLTNVALAFLREPELVRNLAGLTVMGGAARGPGKWGLRYAEHNIACDPEAAHIVFSAGLSMTLVPLDVTQEVRIRPEGVSRIRSGGSAFHEAVARQVVLYPHFRDHGYTFLHDPLAVATLLQPDLVSLEELHVDVELGGRHSAGATLMRSAGEAAPVNARVALEVRGTAFEELLVEQISQLPSQG